MLEVCLETESDVLIPGARIHSRVHVSIRRDHLEQLASRERGEAVWPGLRRTRPGGINFLLAKTDVKNKKVLIPSNIPFQWRLDGLGGSFLEV